MGYEGKRGMDRNAIRMELSKAPLFARSKKAQKFTFGASADEMLWLKRESTESSEQEKS